MDELILLKNIPAALTESLMERLSVYTVAFLTHDGSADEPSADLLGTGVLVSARGRRAILTADHVAERLPPSGRFGLFLNRTSHPHSVAREGAEVVRIARGRNEAAGPDLAVVLLSPTVAGSIGAIKSFYNLDKVRDELLNSPPAIDLGAWFAQGFLDERTSVGPDRFEEGFTKYFFNFTGVGAPDRIEVIGNHDYFDFPVSADSRRDSPVRWGGMSGGGVWQVPFRRREDQLEPLPPLLSGLMFYQHETTETTCGVRCHGRGSIYGPAFKTVAGEP